MGIVTTTKVTTDDTKKTYDFPSKTNPQIWNLKLVLDGVVDYTGDLNSGHRQEIGSFFVERATLERIGKMPVIETDGEPTPPTPRTVEELLNELLDLMAVLRES